MSNRTTIALLLLSTLPLTCYGVYCDSDLAWRTEFLHTIDLPASATDIKNETWGAPYYFGEYSRSWFTIDSSDLCELIRQLDDSSLSDSPPHDSILFGLPHTRGYWSQPPAVRGFLRSGDT